MDTQQPQDNSLLADSVTKALAYTENGGAPDLDNPKTGKSGEAKSIFQFTPATWKQDAKEILGNENAPITADNETYVVHQKVKQWLKEGKSVPQIASMWNAGPGEPDAHTGKFSNGSPSVGINKKYKVKFDVPGYAKKVEAYTKDFLLEKSHQANAPVGVLPTQSQETSTDTQVPDTMKTTTSPATKVSNFGLIKGLLTKKPS